MKRKAIILAGGLKKPPLQEITGRHVLTLPVSDSHTLLDAWVAALSAILGANDPVQILVSEEGDAQQIRALLESPASPFRRPVEVIVDARRWRGTAGVVRDCLDFNQRSPDQVIVAEATCAPPVALDEMTGRDEPGGDVLIGASTASEPAGVYLANTSVFSEVPSVGYMDFKEQFLGHLIASGRCVRTARVCESVSRLRCWPSYQAFIAIAREDASRAGLWRMNGFRPPAATGMRRRAIVERGSEVAENAVIHETVILRDAIVQPGSIVSRSLVCGGHVIQSGSRVIDAVFPYRVTDPGRKQRSWLPAGGSTSS